MKQLPKLFFDAKAVLSNRFGILRGCTLGSARSRRVVLQLLIDAAYPEVEAGKVRPPQVPRLRLRPVQIPLAVVTHL
jgi:hypothetical protein